MAGRRGRGIATLVAVAVVLGWLVVGGVAGPYSGKLGDVATNDNASFLPTDAEATRAQNLAAGFVEKETTPALVVYERTSGITDADRQRAAADVARFGEIQGVQFDCHADVLADQVDHVVQGGEHAQAQ